jgi:hypothetical protein
VNALAGIRAMSGLRRAGLALALLIAVSPPLSAGERQLIAAGDLKAFVTDGPGWCGRSVNIVVRAPTDTPFRDDRIELQKMLGRIRLALEDECPVASLVRLTGFAGGTAAFRGTAAKAHNWVLVDIPLAAAGSPSPAAEKGPGAVAPAVPAAPLPPSVPAAENNPGQAVAAPGTSAPRSRTIVQRSPLLPPPGTLAAADSTRKPPATAAPASGPPSSPPPPVATAAVPPPPADATPRPAPAEAADPVANCDRLAAHRDDPQKTGSPGVADEEIDTAKAIAACGAAAKGSPKTARLRFQLARAYWAAERFEDAIEEFIGAGELEHGGALAYLGDAALYGVAGLDPDPETAKGLYQQAADAGFKPAAALAAEIVAGVKVEEPPQAVYEEPELVKALVTGGAPVKTGMPAPVTLIYVVSAVEGVLHHCPEAVSSDYDLEKSADKTINAALAALPPDQRASVERAAGDGTYRPLMQAGLDDGYAVAATKGCKASETETLIKTALRVFAPGP